MGAGADGNAAVGGYRQAGAYRFLHRLARVVVQRGKAFTDTGAVLQCLPPGGEIGVATADVKGGCFDVLQSGGLP